MSSYQEMLDGAKGGDGASLMEQRYELEGLQELCMREVRRVASANPNIVTSADVRKYEQEVISAHALEISGIIKHEEKVRRLKELKDRWIPLWEADARVLERKFRTHIEHAIGQKWIGRRSAARWMKRLAQEVGYWDKKQFIENMGKFPKYLQNWQKAAEKRVELLKHPLLKSVTAKDVKNLSIFLNEEHFLNRPYEERENLVQAVQAALSAKEKHMPALHAQAKSMLEAAANRKALSWNKVGVWLNRIFKSGASAELIEEFLSGSGAAIAGEKMTLARMIQNWEEASNDFRAIENQRKKKGTPRGVHFVSMEVFLNWRYEQRKAYLKNAEHAFDNIQDESYVFLKIRHELASKDWDSARDLIDGVKREVKDGTLLMSEENATKLQAMEKYLREHQSADPSSKKEAESPDEVLAELRGLINQIEPPSLRVFYEKALNRGYQAFWAWTTVMYNRVWCYQHNYLDEEREQKLERESKEKTRQRMREGHQQTGLEANVVKDDTNAQAAVRDQQNIRAAQMLFMNERSSETVINEVNEQKNARNFWYWTSAIPEGVSYAQHLCIVQTLHPKMKKLARKLEQLGVAWPLSHTTPSSLEPASSAHPAEPQYSMVP